MKMVVVWWVSGVVVGGGVSEDGGGGVVGEWVVVGAFLFTCFFRLEGNLDLSVKKALTEFWQAPSPSSEA